jgi:hypothetical protein
MMLQGGPTNRVFLFVNFAHFPATLSYMLPRASPIGALVHRYMCTATAVLPPCAVQTQSCLPRRRGRPLDPPDPGPPPPRRPRPLLWRCLRCPRSIDPVPPHPRMSLATGCHGQMQQTPPPPPTSPNRELFQAVALMIMLT